MKIVTHAYQFARLHLIRSNSKSFEEFLLEAFSKPVHVTKGNFRFMVANYKHLDFKGNAYIYGELFKYKHLLENEVINEKTKEVKVEDVEFGIVATSKFFIHCGSNIIAFRPVSGRISAQQVYTHLADLIEEGHNRFFVSAEIDPIIEEIRISDFINSLISIQKIFVDVRPTNPSNREVYKELDERLHRLEVEREQRTVSARSGGFNIEELRKDEIFQSIYMATDGYGVASVTGVSESGEIVTLNTDDSPVIMKVVDNDDPVNILGQLHEIIKKLWNRTHPHD